MASLTQEQKLGIVQRLACYETPSDVRDWLKEEFKIDAPLSQIARYDPFNLAGQSLSPELKAAFAQARQSFNTDRERIAIAQTNWRLKELEGLYREAKKRKAVKLAADLLKQGAMDVGGMFERLADKSNDGFVNDLPEALENAVEKVYGDSATQSSKPSAS